MPNPDYLDQVTGHAGTFLDEFKAFALKGNIVDLAVAVVIGAAFKSVVDSLVASFITPLIALVVPNVEDLDGWTLGEFGVGAFLASVISFLITALVLFIIIKKVLAAIQNLRRQEEVDTGADVAAPSAEEKLLTEIRDLLAEQKGIPAPATRAEAPLK